MELIKGVHHFGGGSLYRAFESKLSPTMRQTHAAGERLFVDYAGDGVPVVIDRATGEMRMAQIFVAVLGASSFTFACATWTQALPDWIDAHVAVASVIDADPIASAVRVSRSMRRRSFSRRRRAFSAAKSTSAGGIAACVLGRRGDPAWLPALLLRQARSRAAGIPSSPAI